VALCQGCHPAAPGLGLVPTVYPVVLNTGFHPGCVHNHSRLSQHMLQRLAANLHTRQVGFLSTQATPMASGFLRFRCRARPHTIGSERSAFMRCTGLSACDYAALFWPTKQQHFCVMDQ
jgi:hypothetical protein